jgi:uncharacterized protein YeaO (DUF488 family)
MIRVKRAYEAPAADDGTRFLVDRLWPRGIKKEALKLDGWIKEIAPSNELRQWFHHERDQWDEFQARYARELDAQADRLKPILEAARRGTVTLVYSARDETYNNAVALKQYLEARLKGT